MVTRTRNVELYAFPSELGWMAAVAIDGRLAQLAFGGQTPQAVTRRLDAELAALAWGTRGSASWVRLLQQYAEGSRVNLEQIPLALPDTLTPFQRRVLELCRRIPFGRLATYGELAARAGYPRAARAVGNVMAANRVPIVVPCHRVVPAGGKLGRYSAPGGVRTKLRLLELEGCAESLWQNANAACLVG
jgi:methylated-DNA-[protein]-cysteine S-methyltransferase